MEAQTDSAAVTLSAGRRRLLMLALVLATGLASLDASFVPIAFPDLIDDLDTSTGTVVWVALGYLLAATGPMLFFARLGDRLGKHVLFRLGTALYSLAMIACAVAPDVGTLIAIRVVQGVGMAMFLPATFAMAAAAYPAGERGRALGVLASANSAGFILGPVFAGWLLDAYDWRALFAGRAPLAVLAVLLAFVAFPRDRRAAVAARWRGLDVGGALLLSGSLFGLLYGLNRLPVEDNHLNPMVWVVFVAGLALLLVFVRHERGSAAPLVDISLFRTSPGFAKASIAFFMMFASFPVYLFILPLLLIAGLELRAWDAGLLLAVVALITFIVSPWAGRLSDRVGPDLPCSVGALFSLAGYLTLLGVHADSSIGYLLLPMVLFGFGSGFFFSPNNRLMMSSVPPAQATMASGMIGTVRQSGYALGFAVTASLFTVVQSRLEQLWTRRALTALPAPEARELARIFDHGGVWSPELLIYILHLGAILSATFLVVALVYSLPRTRFGPRRTLVTLGSIALAGAVALALVIGFVEVRVVEQPEMPGNELLALSAGTAAGNTPSVAPFGMARRAARPIMARAVVLPTTGREVFAVYCAACHGGDGRGLPDLGVDLTTSSFVRQSADSTLAAYLYVGRPSDDPLSRTGRAMPGMKDFLTFTEENYRQVVAHLRLLGTEASDDKRGSGS